MEMNTIYSKELCPFCEAAENWFKVKRLPYTKLVLGTDFEREEFINKFGEGSTYPQIYVWDKHVGGFDDLLEYADNHGMNLQTQNYYK